MPSLKLISATDTEYSVAVLKSLNEQRSHGLFCDITIIIRDKKFRAHKTILSASSTYFHQLFTVAGQVIELNFIRAEIFEEILNYIYTSRIVRVRSDMLEELIQAGKILGVKFIANLASPLSQVKGLPGLSKEPENQSDDSSEMMPIISESFSISAEEFNQVVRPEDNDEDSDSDVMFVSQTTTANQKNNAEVIDLESAHSENTSIADVKQGLTRPQKTYSIRPRPHSRTKGSSPMQSPDSSSNNSSFPGSRPTAPAMSTGIASEPTGSSVSDENNDTMGVHKKQVSAADQHGDLKIRLVDVSESKSNESNSSTSDIEAQQNKIAAEIDTIDSDYEIYSNIGETTFDIETSKDDPGEGGSKANKGKRAYMATLTKAFDDIPDTIMIGPKSKKGKPDPDDHYELVMDGKTFYVCVVCKRPYVCLTSLRRHFNTHSWEKKYPCRHCNKVFALAEYRTKHEITHTGERRYQCLLCNDMFLNYQFLSNHCKQIHNQDPSGRKAKDFTDNNLYRLLPCKTVPMKSYSWVTDSPPSDGTTVISEDGSLHEINANDEDSTQRRMLNWDDIFIEPDAHSQPGSSVNNSNQGETEFEFVMPETYTE